MHETGIARNLVRRVVMIAREARAERVAGVDVWLGALSQFTPRHFREHFQDEARGTLAEGAAVNIVSSTDTSHPDAMGVLLQSLDLEVPDHMGGDDA